MRHLALLALLAAASLAQERPLAFVDVTVVPMDTERVVPHCTVLVRDGRIEAAGPAGEVSVPAEALRVDGTGRFLMPGLADMHVHVWYEEEFRLYLANGVTTVRNCWGAPLHRRWMGEIGRGERPAPTLITTSPILDGEKPVWDDALVLRTPEEARREIARLDAQGYAQLKVYNRMRREVYEAIVAEAHDRGLRVVGHVPWHVTIDGALAARQDCIDHLDGYFVWPLTFDEQVFADRVRRTVEAGIWNCPTVVAYQKLGPPAEMERLRARPEMRYVPPRLRATWTPAHDFRVQDVPEDRFAVLRASIEHRLRAIRMLHEAGANLVLGTDAGNPFVVAGWALHEELANYVRAGLSPYEALRCATVEAARFLDQPFGMVKPGLRADLVLVEADPLEEVAHARRIAGVMVRGRWMARAELQRGLEELAAGYAEPKARFEGLPDLPEGRPYRYEVLWNGVVVGEERFVLRAAGGGVTAVIGQQVNDPPWNVRKQFRLEFDERGVLRDLPASGAADLQTLALWIALGRRWRDLGPGATWSGEWDGAATLQAERIEDEQGDRVFVVRALREDRREEYTVRYDRDGVPVWMETGLQLGVVRYRRLPK